MKRFILLSFTAFLMACGGLKNTGSQYSQIAGTNSTSERDQYVFSFEKKAGDYVEIVEVKLINIEKGSEESSPFQVMDAEAKQTILDVKGRDAFTVVAAKPAGKDNVLATSAVIVYRTEKDGDKKTYTVKKIGSK